MEHEENFAQRVAEMNESTPCFSAELSCEKRVYTVSEIQSILEISPSTAYELIKKKLFRVVRISGGIIRISKRSFDEWLDGIADLSSV